MAIPHKYFNTFAYAEYYNLSLSVYEIYGPSGAKVIGLGKLQGFKEKRA